MRREKAALFSPNTTVAAVAAADTLCSAIAAKTASLLTSVAACVRRLCHHRHRGGAVMVCQITKSHLSTATTNKNNICCCYCHRHHHHCNQTYHLEGVGGGETGTPAKWAGKALLLPLCSGRSAPAILSQPITQQSTSILPLPWPLCTI